MQQSMLLAAAPTRTRRPPGEARQCARASHAQARRVLRKQGKCVARQSMRQMRTSLAHVRAVEVEKLEEAAGKGRNSARNLGKVMLTRGPTLGRAAPSISGSHRQGESHTRRRCGVHTRTPWLPTTPPPAWRRGELSGGSQRRRRWCNCLQPTLPQAQRSLSVYPACTGGREGSGAAYLQFNVATCCGFVYTRWVKQRMT